ncbi:unnamed protein product [Alternaria sp. RS040]
MSRLLQLPRELRDVIYAYYFRGEGGFVYDFAANKIRRADGYPIELSLVLTCRHVAAEAHGLALQINAVRFATFHSDDTQEQASVLHIFNEEFYVEKESLLDSLAPKLLSPEQAQAAKSLYPQFAPVIDHWRLHGGIHFLCLLCSKHRVTPSIWRDFVAFTLNLISQQPGFLGEARALKLKSHQTNSGAWYGPGETFGLGPKPMPDPDPHEDKRSIALNEAKPMPWQITALEEIAELRRLTIDDNTFPYSNTKYSYSAASAALRWLHSIPKAMRDNIRKIVLMEDRESIAFPQSHGRGFIDICQDHPQLKVERFVSLWRTAIPVSYEDEVSYLAGTQEFIDDGLLEDDRCHANVISKGVGAWIMEAMALPSLGMPHGSFTLVLDGDPLPEQTSRLFRIIQRDAAWQSALNICYTNGLLPRPSWLEKRLETAGFIHEEFPEAVGAISTHSSLVRTNFPVSAPCDVEQLLREHEGWTLEDWEAGWALHEPREFQTEAPLPPWHLLRWQHVIR